MTLELLAKIALILAIIIMAAKIVGRLWYGP